MIFVDKMKNLKIYKSPMFLPTLENDKKRKSAILLMTPDYSSSKKLLSNPLFINKLRFSSYYIERDISYYIGSDNSLQEAGTCIESYIENATELSYYQNLLEMTTAEKSKLKDSDFGLPRKRKYPLDNPDKVRSAVKFFNYCSKEDEQELAENIIKALKKFNLDITVGEKNRLSKYYKGLSENVLLEQQEIVPLNTPDDPIVTVSATIMNEDYKILLENHIKSGAYTVPGGKVDPNENFEDAIRRELFEELGIEVQELHQPKDNITFFVCEYPVGSGKWYYFKDYNFHIISYKGEIENKEPNKHSDLLWIRRDEIYKSNIKANKLLEGLLAKRNKHLTFNGLEGNDNIAVRPSHITFEGTFEDCKLLSKICTVENYLKILDFIGFDIISLADIPAIHLSIGDEEKSTYSVGIYGNLCANIQLQRISFMTNDDICQYINYYAICAIIESLVAGKYPSTRKTMVPLMFSHAYFDLDDYYTATYKALYEETNGQIYKMLGIGDVESIVKIANKHDIPIRLEDWDAREVYAEDKSNNGGILTRDFLLKEYEKHKAYVDSRFNELNESCLINKETVVENITAESFVQGIPSSCLNTGDKVIFFNEDANDNQIRRLIYKDRLKVREDLLLLYEQVQKDFPFIKYAFPDIERYKSKNLFIDFYFYNKLFFENNIWVQKKGLTLFTEFMNRLINNPKITKAGYEKKTIFIPVLDWDKSHDGFIWNYKKSINPLSLIYYYMSINQLPLLQKMFGDNDIIFIGKGNYFKINFGQIDPKNLKQVSNKFKLYLIKMCKNEDFDPEDTDESFDNTQSADVIRTNIADKIELSKGIDITPQLNKLDKAKHEHELSKNKSNKAIPINPLYDNSTKQDKSSDSSKVNKDSESEKVISKATLNQPDSQSKKDMDKDLEKLAAAVDSASSYAKSEEDALDIMDDMEIRQILIDLDSVADDKVNITAARASRISELDKKLLETEVKGKSIKDILSEEPKETATTNLEIASPNEEWKNLSYMNFDKNYNIDKDIISCFKFFETVSRPISIRNISVVDNSTSEDRVELYTVEMEDYRGKRFTIKLDIPVLKDNRFLLRGNNKSIQTQLFNMPIIKTDFDTCQIISNYMKIFVRKFGSSAGKSLPYVSRFIKASNKYTGKAIKFELGDNSKICDKYELPIDYIDLASTFNKIETSDFIIYFNQDEIRNLYTVEEGIGIPYLYDKNRKVIEYLDKKSNNTFIYCLINLFEFTYNRNGKYNDFVELINSASSPTICSYSRCSIMNSQIPLILICAYHEGLRKTLDKANIDYSLQSSLTKEIKNNINNDWIKFKDGYVVFRSTYSSSLLMNGLKECPTEMFELSDIDNKNMYLEFLDNFGGRIKADGLENFYDLEIDPLTKEVLEFYKLPTDYVSILLYANALLADNKFIKHTDTSSRRLRRYELIAVYTYKVLADAYASYANQLKHSREAAEFSIKQSAVIDKFLLDSISSDDSCINALRDIETTNSLTTKGPSGMNSDRAYSLDKRTYSDSMLNVIGMSTGFAANVGITRQATIDANIEGERGYIKSINGDTEKMNSAKSLTATEAMTPFGTTRDDPIRTAMTFIQTAKHAVRTEESDPLLVSNGFDQAMPYISSDRFAFKAKKSGKVEEITEDYIMLAYDDGTKDYINLSETIEKNSDGGYYVPLKLDKVKDLRVGSKVKENQIIAYDKYSFSNSLGESDNLAYNIGKLAKIAIINTDEGFEDSGIITESMAKKLATRINLKFEATIDKDSNVYSIAKIGQHVECRDNLLVWQAPFDDEDANSLLKTIAGDEVSELGKRKLVSEVTGTVTAIKIFRTVELDEMSDSLRKIVEDYEKPLVELEKKLKANNLDTSQIPAHYILPPTGKLKKAQEAVIIEFYVEYFDTVGIGDKVVYFSANKAIEKNIIPKGKEPYTEFRPNESVDAFVSETSIDKRMVTSTVTYGSIQKLMIELDRSVKDILGIPYDDSTV